MSESKLPLTLLRRGKVRDVYRLGNDLLMVASDRISAFDHVLPTPIPDKGKWLTQASVWWFERTKDIVPNHLISADVKEMDAALGPEYEGRTLLVREAKRFDAECVVRGYLAGSGWKEYQKTGTVCGRELPEGLKEASKLPEPIFTPATKADSGHDENVSFERFSEIVGPEHARTLERLSLALYERAAKILAEKGLILADTKFEFGLVDDRPTLIDEALTPDSSRLWPADRWRPGGSPPSFDKQYVRDYLESCGWDKRSEPPALPAQVVNGTAKRYQEYLGRLSR